MSETIYNQRNREVILDRAKDYYKNNKKIIKRKSKSKYRELSEEEKTQREYGGNRHLNMSEEKKKN